MKKKRFLKELEEELVDFENKEKLLAKYSRKIDQKVAKGMSELKAVASLGNIEEIVQNEKKLLKTKKDQEELKKFLKQSDKFIKKASIYVAGQFKKAVDFFKENNVSAK